LKICRVFIQACFERIAHLPTPDIDLLCCGDNTLFGAENKEFGGDNDDAAIPLVIPVAISIADSAPK
jgi:hypothetical protein